MTQLTRGLSAGAVGNGGLLLPGKSIQTPSRWSGGGSRTQVLYNRGEFFLSILPNGTIRPSVDKSNIFAVLQLYTVAASVVAIQARMTGYFLCMNYLSHLYTSKNYTDNCAFYEKLLKQYYTTFYSNRYKKERNQTWYISIDRRGRPRKGARSNEHQPRVQFLPLDADLDLIRHIEEHQQRTKTTERSNTSATTSIDAIRTVVPPLPSSFLGVTTTTTTPGPPPPPLPDIPRRCSGTTRCRKRGEEEGRRRRRRCRRRKQKGKRRRCKKKKERKRERERKGRKNKNKKLSDGSVVVNPTTGLQTPRTLRRRRLSALEEEEEEEGVKVIKNGKGR